MKSFQAGQTSLPRCQPWGGGLWRAQDRTVQAQPQPQRQTVLRREEGAGAQSAEPRGKQAQGLGTPLWPQVHRLLRWAQAASAWLERASWTVHRAERTPSGGTRVSLVWSPGAVRLAGARGLRWGPWAGRGDGEVTEGGVAHCSISELRAGLVSFPAL